MINYLFHSWSNWVDIDLQYNPIKHCNILTQMRVNKRGKKQFNCIKFCEYIVIKDLKEKI